MFFNFTDRILAQDIFPASRSKSFSPLLPLPQSPSSHSEYRYLFRMPSSDIQMDELDLSNIGSQINDILVPDTDCANCLMISNQTEIKTTQAETAECLNAYYADFFQKRLDGIAVEMKKIKQKLNALDSIQSGLSKEVDYKKQYRTQLMKEYHSYESAKAELVKLQTQSKESITSDTKIPSFKSIDALSTYLQKMQERKVSKFEAVNFDTKEMKKILSSYQSQNKTLRYQSYSETNYSDAESNETTAAKASRENIKNTDENFCDEDWKEKDNSMFSMSRLEDFLRSVDLPKNKIKSIVGMDRPKDKKQLKSTKDPVKLLVNYPDLFMQLKANPVSFDQLLAKNPELQNSFEEQMNEVANLIENKDPSLFNPDLAKYFYLLYLRDYKKRNLSSSQANLLAQLQDQFLQSDSNAYKKWFEKNNALLGHNQCRNLSSAYFDNATDDEIRLSFFESEMATFDLNMYRNFLQDLSAQKRDGDTVDKLENKLKANQAFETYKNRKCMNQVQRYSFEEDPERFKSRKPSVYSISDISESKILNYLSLEEKKIFFSDTSANLNFLFRRQPESQNSFECMAFTISNEMQKVKIKDDQILQSPVVSGLKVHEILSTKILKKDISQGVEYNDVQVIYRSLEKPNSLGMQNNNIQSFTPSYKQEIDTNSLRRALDKGQSLVVMTDTDTRRYVGGVVQLLPGKSNHISQMIGYDKKYDYNYGLSRNIFIFRDSINNNSNTDVYIPEDYIRSSALQVTILP